MVNPKVEVSGGWGSCSGTVDEAAESCAALRGLPERSVQNRKPLCWRKWRASSAEASSSRHQSQYGHGAGASDSVYHSPSGTRCGR